MTDMMKRSIIPTLSFRMPKTSTVGDALAEMTDSPDKRPKLTVVTPGMKDYSPRVCVCVGVGVVIVWVWVWVLVCVGVGVLHT